MCCLLPIAWAADTATDDNDQIKPATTANSPTLKININGLDDELRANVLAYLRLNRFASGKQALPDEARLRWLHDKAEQDIRQALQPFGYYKPQLTNSQLNRTDDGWQAEYTIQPGSAIAIATLDIQILGAGQDDANFKKILDEQPLAEGQTLRHARYETLKQQLQSVATERGYFDARFSQSQIRIDLEAYQARIRLHYQTGERYRFGEVIFLQDEFADEFLSRYLDFQPGDPYYAPILLSLQSNLINSEYFDQVSIAAPLEKAENKVVPVEVTLSPRKKRQYSLGLGYGTDTGIRGRGGLEQRRVNRWGHNYELQLLASQIQYSLAGEYIIPGDDPRTDSYRIRSTLTQEDSDVKEATTATLGFSQQRQDGLWLKIASLDYQYEKFTFSDETEETKLLIGSLNWTRVAADPDRINVTAGSRIGFEIRVGADFLLSDISFAQAAVNAKWIRALNDKSRILLRGTAGTTYIDNKDFPRFPTSLRFFTGGDRSVRGYSLDIIGPRNDEDDVIGGKHVIAGSVEYEYRILDKWSLAAFVDAGDAFNNSPNLKTGVGVGVRWQSPIGPVRVDLASGLDEPGDTFRVHISIGPDL